MKRFFIILLAVVLVCGLTACGPGMSGEPEVPPTEETKPVTPPPAPTQPTEPPVTEHVPEYPIAISEIWYKDKKFDIANLKTSQIEKLGFECTEEKVLEHYVDGLLYLDNLTQFANSKSTTVLIGGEDKVTAIGTHTKTKGSEDFVYILGIKLNMSREDTMQRLVSFGISDNSEHVTLCDDKYTISIRFNDNDAIEEITVYQTDTTKQYEPNKPQDESPVHDSDETYKQEYLKYSNEWPQEIETNMVIGENEKSQLTNFTINGVKLDIKNDKVGVIYKNTFDQLQAMGAFKIEGLLSVFSRTFTAQDGTLPLTIVSNPETKEILMISLCSDPIEDFAQSESYTGIVGLQAGMPVQEAIALNESNQNILPIEFVEGINIAKDAQCTLIVEVANGYIKQITLINNCIYNN